MKVRPTLCEPPILIRVAWRDSVELCGNLRLLTSAQIRYDPGSYEPFLFHPELGYQMKPIEFCNTPLESTGKEPGMFPVL